jgi:hypothetical protein
VIQQFGDVDFLPLRLQDAFDRTWWDKIGAGTPNATLGADFADEGTHLNKRTKKKCLIPVKCWRLKLE